MTATNPRWRRRRTTGVDAPRPVGDADIDLTRPAEVQLDDLLLARTARGDQSSFSTLYDRLMPAVFGLCLRVVRDPAQAEEVAQEAMVEVWRIAARFDGGRGSARTFVMTIAHRRAVDRVRSEEASRRREATDARSRSVAPTVEAEPDAAVIESLERQQVRVALDRLTPIQREAVELAYYDGRTHAEVAALLEVPLGTVKTRIRDGLIRLRDSMGVAT